MRHGPQLAAAMPLSFGVTGSADLLQKPDWGFRNPAGPRGEDPACPLGLRVLGHRVGKLLHPLAHGDSPASGVIQEAATV